jgi:hypothetical protein
MSAATATMALFALLDDVCRAITLPTVLLV